MATKARDRVKETTTTTGTGNITLGGAVLGFRTVIAALNVGDSHDFCIDSGRAEWEVSRCTVVSSTVISRDTVKASSNSGSLVNFSAGIKNVFLMPSAINGLTNESLEVMAANTVKANITGSSAAPTDASKASFITWLALAVGDISGAAATASISAVGFSGAWADISGKPTFAAVSTSGAYADLSGKPVLVAVSTSGSASDLTAGTLPAARLPTPTSTSLGGVMSVSSSTGSAIVSIGTDGVPVLGAVAASGGAGPVSAILSAQLWR